VKNPIIAVAAFEGISPFHLSVPCLVFGQDRRSLGLPLFDFRVCAIEQGVINTQSGFSINTQHGLDDIVLADIVIVPSWRDVDEAPALELLNALGIAHKNGALIVGLCLGAFVVAATGLLKGRKATTHWAYADRFCLQFPDVTLEPVVLYVDEGDVITSAGVAAGLDCCLHILRKLYGTKPAAQVARHIVLSPHRQGGQAQFIERPVIADRGSDHFYAVLEDVQSRLADTHMLDMVADAASMTRRTFTRRFQKAYAMSFGDWLTLQRITLAQELLETTRISIEDVALRSGFGTSTSLRKHFSGNLNTTPMQYRREFAATIEG
jgi:AraC family transcriptional regulator, transcriptional activator FtrA